ncbi:hypothetical protein Zmor_015942 [Zophobas morio]|uniref:Uncharacterized protein n=1 Tax=Zophobas morio TaxID=2755281 RepID=A0AA38IHP2_9CUCU|nr:hypothetical protein Zmor_015942 [Zophobas morio]
MRSLLLNLLVCIFRFKVSHSEKNTFVNVTVQWYFYHELETIEQETVASFDNVKKIIPDEEPVSVTIHGSIPILYEKSIFEVPNLVSLDLFNVSLEEIKPGAFENLPLLEKLILSGNKLTEIKTDTFVDLNVTYIDLSSNSIILLQPRAFKNFNASYLLLDNNKLTEFPSGVFDNVTLGNLSLTNNRLHTIAPKALSTVRFRILNLPGNKLEEINPEVFDLQDLTTLNLDSNSVKLLRPGDLRNLPELDELSLVENQLKEIPEGVFNNTKLNDLNLDANKIAKIASGAFDDMKDLVSLRIDFNNLTQWDNNWLGGESRDRFISIHFNQITEIPDDAFKNIPSAFAIHLQGNKIRKISPKAFHQLEDVIDFDLANNEIDRWDLDFLGNTSLDILNLRGNKLECVEGDLQTVFRNVGIIKLMDNPWNEECTKKIEEFLENKNAFLG